MVSKAIKRGVGAAISAALALALLTACAPSTAHFVAGSSLSIGESSLLVNLNAGATAAPVAERAATDLSLLTMPAFGAKNANGTWVTNDGFGSVTSKDAKKVTYQLSGKADWSDGAKVTATDLLLSWAAANNWGSVGFRSRLATTSLAKGKTLPTVIDKSITISYPRVTPDYQSNLPITVAAHLIGQMAFPDAKLTAPDADAKVLQAITSSDKTALLAIATAYNSALASTSEIDGTPRVWTKDQFVTAGPYSIVSATPDKVVLKADPAFQTGKQATVDNLTVHFFTDSNALAAAAAAGEVDLALPFIGATSGLDSLKSTASTGNKVSVYTGYGPAAQYVLFNRAEGSELAVKPDGSNQALVDAKLKATSVYFPRAGITDALAMLNKVEQRDSFVFPNSDSDYGASVSQNGSKQYRFQDAELALKTLQDAGFARRIQLRVLFDSNSANGQLEYGLLARYAKAAGVNVVNVSTDNPDEVLASGEWEIYLTDRLPMKLDASTMALSTGTLTAFNSSKIDALVAKLGSAGNKNTAGDYQSLDQELFASHFGLPVVSEPGLLLYSKKLKNFAPDLTTQQVAWGYWNWDVAATSK